MINAPERIWRLDLADGNDDDRIVYFDTPGPLSTGLDDSVEYVRKGVMDKNHPRNIMAMPWGTDVICKAKHVYDPDVWMSGVARSVAQQKMVSSLSMNPPKKRTRTATMSTQTITLNARHAVGQVLGEQQQGCGKHKTA